MKAKRWSGLMEFLISFLRLLASVKFVILLSIVILISDHVRIHYPRKFSQEKFLFPKLHKLSNNCSTNFKEKVICVMDIDNIKILNEPRNRTKTDIGIVILSSPENFGRRFEMRRQLMELEFPAIFLLGKPKSRSGSGIKAKLNREISEKGDILQLDIQEDYKNLSYKTLSGFAWMNQFIGEWIIKVDDDIDVNWSRMFEELQNLSKGKHKLKSSKLPDFACHAILHNRYPERYNYGINQKLFLSYQDWPTDVAFPSYCNGWLYAVRAENAPKLVKASRETPKLFIDDLYITGILKERLSLTQTEIGWTPWYNRLFRCTVFNLLRVHIFEDLAYPRGDWPWQTLKFLIKLQLNGSLKTEL